MTSMTALLFELERITPTSVTTPVMHATMIDSIKNCLPRSTFRPREAVSDCVTNSVFAGRTLVFNQIVIGKRIIVIVPVLESSFDQTLFVEVVEKRIHDIVFGLPFHSEVVIHSI